MPTRMNFVALPKKVISLFCNKPAKKAGRVRTNIKIVEIVSHGEPAMAQFLNKIITLGKIGSLQISCQRIQVSVGEDNRLI